MNKCPSVSFLPYSNPYDDITALDVFEARRHQRAFRPLAMTQLHYPGTALKKHQTAPLPLSLAHVRIHSSLSSNTITPQPPASGGPSTTTDHTPQVTTGHITTRTTARMSTNPTPTTKSPTTNRSPRSPKSPQTKSLFAPRTPSSKDDNWFPGSNPPPRPPHRVGTSDGGRVDGGLGGAGSGKGEVLEGTAEGTEREEGGGRVGGVGKGGGGKGGEGLLGRVLMVWRRGWGRVWGRGKGGV